MNSIKDFIEANGAYLILSLFFIGPLTILFLGNLNEKLIFSKKPKSLTDA